MQHKSQSENKKEKTSSQKKQDANKLKLKENEYKPQERIEDKHKKSHNREKKCIRGIKNQLQQPCLNLPSRWIRLTNIQKQFEESRRNGDFHLPASMLSPGEFQLEITLNHLKNILTRFNDNEIARRLEKNYWDLNQTNLKLKSSDKNKIKIAEHNAEEVKAISSDICQLAFTKTFANPSYRIKHLILQATSWGISEAMSKAENQEPVDINSNTTMEVHKFAPLLYKKKQLAKEKEQKIRQLSRKAPSVLKFFKKEKRNKRKKKECKHDLQILTKRNYKAKTNEIAYVKIHVHYAKKFMQLDEKAKHLYQMQWQKIEDGEHIHNSTRTFKNCLELLIGPHIYHMNILKQIVAPSLHPNDFQKTSHNLKSIFSSAQYTRTRTKLHTPNDFKKATVGSNLRSFADSALGVVLNETTEW
ncbi:MAG: hypothetical protein LBJ83_03050 [Oscillospiraceae bacterium]|nr:hypothetical protein [Oscillospiraceae bacterium]